MFDTLVVLVIVAAAGWYVFRRFVAVGRGKGGGCGCGCSGNDGGCACTDKAGRPTACPGSGKEL
ncbi:MAG: FeoB-associated Cys-rich membrane protein [Desulfovibrionaceae bacterium]